MKWISSYEKMPERGIDQNGIVCLCMESVLSSMRMFLAFYNEDMDAYAEMDGHKAYFDYWFRLPDTPTQRAMLESMELSNKLNKRIDEIDDLNRRAQNSLIYCGNMQTLRDVVTCRWSDIIKLRNLGKKTCQEIHEYLLKQGLDFGMKLED